MSAQRHRDKYLSLQFFLCPYPTISLCVTVMFLSLSLASQSPPTFPFTLAFLPKPLGPLTSLERNSGSFWKKSASQGHLWDVQGSGMGAKKGVLKAPDTLPAPWSWKHKFHSKHVPS